MTDLTQYGVNRLQKSSYTKIKILKNWNNGKLNWLGYFDLVWPARCMNIATNSLSLTKLNVHHLLTMINALPIKGDRPLMRDMLNAPWLLTDNFHGLVMVIRNYHWLNSAIRVLRSTCSAPLVQMGERKQFYLFDLDLWPTILTYNPTLAKVKVARHAKNQGQRPNGSNRRAPTDKRTETHTDVTKRIISPATPWLHRS